jgi:hypothetical protein
MSVRVRAKLPKGEGNGLAPWESKLAANPDKPIVVVALMRADTVELRPHDEDDPQVVKCVFLGVEALANGEPDAKTVEGILRSIYEARTGRMTLPFEEGDA